ncbi:glycosyltransferase [Azonexus sp.]|jgi:spore maturation protein CgeB|uniref:CgeB family protein n=1 Tax=Azonexus sp. TaxID=1872668 RepID=UPI0028202F1C|nr:glycosyltransferase [Azonexus sp.]MDR1996642.1 glycosyltransferase [Azonexus sp.]
MSTMRKLLILDGIAGVPLGRELQEAFRETGVEAAHVDCLQQACKPLYGVRSAWAKLRNRESGGDSFYFLPKLLEKDLREWIAREQPSHILVIGFIYKFFDPALLRRLADETGIALLLYDTDTCNLYGRRREFIFFIECELPVYDHIFSCSLVTTRFFQDTRRLDTSFLPFGAKPIPDLPSSSGDKPLDVLFVGSCDLRRIFLLEGIRDHVTIRGNRWRRNMPLISAPLQQRVDDRPIWGAELHRMLDQAKIVLNITRTDFHGAETGINLRIFEALAAGCFLLTDHCDELATLFAVGEEIETYRSAAELSEKVRYYLAHPEERTRIANQGHAAFRASHTWGHRATDILHFLQRDTGKPA